MHFKVEAVHAQPRLLHPEQGPPLVEREMLKAACCHGRLLMPTCWEGEVVAVQDRTGPPLDSSRRNIVMEHNAASRYSTRGKACVLARGLVSATLSRVALRRARIRTRRTQTASSRSPRLDDDGYFGGAERGAPGSGRAGLISAACLREASLASASTISLRARATCCCIALSCCSAAVCWAVV